MKGTTVTRAAFGSDAYEFAEDQATTLLSVGELLGMLQHHGHRAEVDLAEAKTIG